MEYLPTFTIKINHSWIGKYTKLVPYILWVMFSFLFWGSASCQVRCLVSQMMGSRIGRACLPGMISTSMEVTPKVLLNPCKLTLFWITVYIYIFIYIESWFPRWSPSSSSSSSSSSSARLAGQQRHGRHALRKPLLRKHLEPRMVQSGRKLYQFNLVPPAPPKFYSSPPFQKCCNWKIFVVFFLGIA